MEVCYMVDIRIEVQRFLSTKTQGRAAGIACFGAYIYILYISVVAKQWLWGGVPIRHTCIRSELGRREIAYHAIMHGGLQWVLALHLHLGQTDLRAVGQAADTRQLFIGQSISENRAAGQIQNPSQHTERLLDSALRTVEHTCDSVHIFWLFLALIFNNSMYSIQCGSFGWFQRVRVGVANRLKFTGLIKM